MKSIESLSVAQLKKYLQKTTEFNEVLEDCLSKYQDLRKLMSAIFEEPTTLENSFTHSMSILYQGIQEEIYETINVLSQKQLKERGNYSGN